MALEDDKNKKLVKNAEEEGGDETGSGQSGSQGQVEFHDFMTAQLQRDDFLSPAERKRLLIVHKSTHERLIKKQKEALANRKALKEGKISLATFHQFRGAGSHPYKTHPALANKAQFSGIDKQVNILPNENIAETNQDKRERLEYQYNLRHRPQAAPKFTPPKLTPGR